MKEAEYSYSTMDVKLPKMDIETSQLNQELIPFLQSQGVGLAFDSGNADFSAICDSGMFIGEIVQKTKIKTDENGLEASAATSIMMLECSTEIQNPEIKEFYATEPFKFLVFTQYWRTRKMKSFFMDRW